MAHHHSHGSHAHSHSSTRNIGMAFWLNALFVVVEIVGGLLTNSIAILSDALHDFFDCLSLGLSWWLQRKSQQPPSARFPFGYKRFSLLGVLFLSSVLLVGSVGILVAAVGRLAHPESVDAHGMLWLAIVGIAVNGAAALRVSRGTSLNERAVYLHIMEDALGWVAVLVGAIVMLFADVPWLDPLLSIGISVWVLLNVVRNLRATLLVLLESTPADVPLDALRAAISALDGVERVDQLRVWSLDGETHVMTLRLVAHPAAAAALGQAVRTLAAEHHIDDVTLELLPPAEATAISASNQ